MNLILPLGFIYSGEHVTPDGKTTAIEPTCNLMPQVAIDHVAGLLRGTTSTIGNWYMFVFENNYTPVAATTSAILQTTVGESTAYDEAARPAWTHAYDGVSVVDNLASRAVFTFNAAKTIYGAGIISASTKGGASGTILSIARFATAESVQAGGELRLSAGIGLVPLA